MMQDKSITMDFDVGDLQGAATENFQITVKFLTEDESILTQAHFSNDSVLRLKKKFVKIFNVPQQHIIILHDNIILRNSVTLGSLARDEFDILQLTVKSNNHHFSIVSEVPHTPYVIPDILTVKVKDKDEVREVVVEVENRAIIKPDLGGFKDVNTGTIYHNGYSQTGPPPPKVPPWMKTHRDTQTYFMRNRKTETTYARATQMWRSDVYIPTVTDVILTAGPYETADEREKRLDVENKVRTIQRYFRAWKTRKIVKELSDEYKKRIRLEKERDEREMLDDEARKRRDLVSKVFPVTPGDFAMLYTMVDKWKKAEIARISTMHCGASKIAELYILLEKEIDILRNLECLHHLVRRELEVKQTRDFFRTIGDPVDWFSSYKNLHIFMDTLETQKGREYFALYKKMVNKDMNYDERMLVYEEILNYLSTHRCPESQNIIKLIGRTMEFLARGISTKYLRNQEMLLLEMVLHHFKLVECNERVTVRMKKDMTKKMEDCMFCQSCERLRPIETFNVDARTKKVKICNRCKWLDKAEEPWIDLRPYRYILKQIRNYERLHHAVSSIVFILKDKDIHHIINSIWHGHSALSECSDIYRLRLVRWKKHEEWSPWNCILLTVEEAKAHIKIVDLEDVYEAEFLNHIFNKHALARKHFSSLADYDRHFTEITKGDDKFNEDSSFYNKPQIECLFGEIPSEGTIREAERKVREEEERVRLEEEERARKKRELEQLKSRLTAKHDEDLEHGCI